MKKSIYFLSTIFAILFLISCSSDDDKGSTSIIGKWYIHSAIYNGETELHENDCETKKDYLEFKESGILVDGYYSTNCTEYPDEYNYTREGNTLTIDGYVYKILELNNSTLKFEDLEYHDITILKK